MPGIGERLSWQVSRHQTQDWDCPVPASSAPATPESEAQRHVHSHMLRVCTSQYVLPPTGTCDCLSFSCQEELPGSHLSVSEWVADLGSQRFPVPGGLHDTTPTSAFCHLSRSMEIERTTSGCWVSQRASRQSLEKEGCRLAPHLSQTLALGQSSWTGRGVRTWSTHPLSRPRNFCQVR